MSKFEKLGLGKNILKVLEELEFLIPTEIQEKTIPLILDGRDVIGHAFTGSGKTFAFGSGIIEKVIPGNGIQALIITPTRELAVQISKVLKQFSKNTGLKLQEIYGGVDMRRQIIGAKKADILIGTPGRLLDHLQSGNFKLNDIEMLVLDEADRLADMGFLPDVDKIVSQCGSKKQVLLFSATVSKDLHHIIKKYMKNPEQVSVKNYVDPSKLKQYFYDTPKHLKFSLLVSLLKSEKSGIVLVFCNTRRTVDMVVRNLERQGIDSLAIHGGMQQNKRNRVMEQFHSDKASILVCTDVAARGLDIKGVTHVYNYDLPDKAEDYVHRIGRTARAGEKGLAINILSMRDYDNFRRITEQENVNVEQKALPDLEVLRADFSSREERPRGRSFGGGDSRSSGRRGFGGRDSRSSGGRKRDFGKTRGGSREARKFGGGDSGRSSNNREPRRKNNNYGGRDREGGRDFSRNSRNSRNDSFRGGRDSGRSSSDKSSGRNYGRKDRDSSNSRRESFRGRKARDNRGGRDSRSGRDSGRSGSRSPSSFGKKKARR
mgnify:CR=1 FL=1